MGNDRTGHRTPIGLTWPGTSYVAAVLAAGVFGGTWLQPVDGRAWQTLLPAVLLTGMAILGFVRLTRAHATRRLKAAMDAFAEERSH
jgi:hypothetical protein